MNKKSKLLAFARNVISDPSNQDEINYLLDKLNLTQGDVIKAYLDWDLDPDAYGNEIYSSIPLRFAMYLHYLLKGSWHEVRQNEIINLLNKNQSKSIIDVGFGAPQKYIKEILLNKEIKLTLAEFDDSALVFGKAILDYWDTNWKDSIELRKYDMDSEKYAGDFEIYMFQDSIEHTKNPTKYLSDLVEQSPINSKFIFSLPIEVENVATGSHYMSWQSETDAIRWLNECGLSVAYSRLIEMNPEVDIFAENMDFYECIYECEKSKS